MIMSNNATHSIRVVGPPAVIARFIKDLDIVSGAVEMTGGSILPGWHTTPQLRMALPTGTYQVETCGTSLCSILIELHTCGTTMDSWVGVCRTWIDAYPELTIIWRYWFDEARYSGYVDKSGNHCWYRNHIDWIEEADNPSPVFVRDFGVHEAAQYVLNYLDIATIEQLASMAASRRPDIMPSDPEHAIYHKRFEATWAYVIMSTAATRLGELPAKRHWQRCWESIAARDSDDVSMLLEKYRFNTLNEAARYVLEPLFRTFILQIAKQAFDVCQKCDNDSAHVVWANVVLAAAEDVLEVSNGAVIRYFQESLQGEVMDDIETEVAKGWPTVEEKASC
jgi:hypothetical protein